MKPREYIVDTVVCYLPGINSLFCAVFVLVLLIGNSRMPIDRIYRYVYEHVYGSIFGEYNSKVITLEKGFFLNKFVATLVCNMKQTYKRNCLCNVPVRLLI